MRKKNWIWFLSLFQVNQLLSCECWGYLVDLPVPEMGWTLNQTARISSISDLIFDGTLIKTTTVLEQELGSGGGSPKVVLTFKLLNLFKGQAKDTIQIRTNGGSEACGFGALLNTNCLIFAHRQPNGVYYTYRSDCCKSISKQADSVRYEKYRKFLHVMIDKIEGNYTFYQTQSYWNGGTPNRRDTLKVLEFSIRNQQLDGSWILYDRQERVLEKGSYQNGQKEGTWVIQSFNESKYPEAVEEIRTETMEYQKGQLIERQTIVEDRALNYESNEDFNDELNGVGALYYVTLRKQIFKNEQLIGTERFDKKGKKRD